MKCQPYSAVIHEKLSNVMVVMLLKLYSFWHISVFSYLQKTVVLGINLPNLNETFH